jgi:membrane protein YqaA with SNARE-associated domain
MNLWTMITVVAVAGILGNIVSAYLKAKTANGKTQVKFEDQSEKIKALEERVQTLEKIVTDSSYSLKNEINGL